MHKNFRTYELAVMLVKEGRKVKLRNPYKDQFERAILSVALNLSEGSAKPSPAERRRFYLIAFASLREVQTLIDILGIASIRELADQTAANLYRLTHALHHNHDHSPRSRPPK